MTREKQTVLVVDDNPDHIALINGLLRQLYQVKVAINGAKAIAMIAKIPPTGL